MDEQQKIECPKHGTMYGYCSECIREGTAEPADPEAEPRKCKCLGNSEDLCADCAHIHQAGVCCADAPVAEPPAVPPAQEAVSFFAEEPLGNGGHKYKRCFVPAIGTGCGTCYESGRGLRSEFDPIHAQPSPQPAGEVPKRWQLNANAVKSWLEEDDEGMWIKHEDHSAQLATLQRNHAAEVEKWNLCCGELEEGLRELIFASRGLVGEAYLRDAASVISIAAALREGKEKQHGR